MMKYSKIKGTGGYLPCVRVSNEELVERLAKRGVESSPEWIAERTGIKARHYAQDGEQTSDLAVAAAHKALGMAGLNATDIDMIVLATSTPDMVFPSTACVVQNKMGASHCAAFDVQAACSGFIYALTVADAMVKSGQIKRVLVIGAEIFSRIIDFNDRTTCVLFGDGAGAVVLEACDEPGILAWDLHANGAEGGVLFIDAQFCDGVVKGNPFIEMDGKAVFRLAVDLLEKTARATLEKAKVNTGDIDWLVPHQANARIIGSTARKLKLPMSKVILTLEEQGNTSAASIPLALDAGVRSDRIKSDQLVLLEGVGAGFTWGSVLLKM